MLGLTREAAELVEISSTAEAGFAARYAAALYTLASERKVLDQVVDEMAALGRLIAQSPELGRLVGDPFADGAQVAPVLNAALAGQGFSEILRNFVGVAVMNRRLRDLPALVAGFARLVAQKRGEIVADVTSAQPLTDLQRNQLRARLAEAGFASVRLAEHVDASLLGGLILKIGSKLYDTSLKSRLNRLSYSLKGAA